MIKIQCNKLEEIEQIHLDACLPWVTESTKFLKQLLTNTIDRKEFEYYKRSFRRTKYLIKISNYDTNEKDFLISFIDSLVSDDLHKKILIGKPQILESCTKKIIDFYNEQDPQPKEDVRNIVNYIFNYTRFTENEFKIIKNNKKWNAYEYSKMLGVNVCPYCNRNFTTTVETTNDKVNLRPELDHFIPKSINPLLAISLYNLIPSCSLCNGRFKKDENVSIQTHIHPFLEGFGKSGLFDYKPIDGNSIYGISSKHKIKINSRNKLKNKINESKKLFCIEKIYETHSDVINELIMKKRCCEKPYLETIIKMFPELKLSKKEAYRLAFGNYYDSLEFQKRPLSKFTRDIADQLDLIDI